MSVWQKHHLSYSPDVTVKIRKGVHQVVTLLNRYKSLSDDERRALIVTIYSKPLLRAGADKG